MKGEMTWPLYEIRVLNEYSIQEIAARTSIPIVELNAQMRDAATRNELIVKGYIPKHNAKWLSENLREICERLHMSQQDFKALLEKQMQEDVEFQHLSLRFWRSRMIDIEE